MSAQKSNTHQHDHSHSHDDDHSHDHHHDHDHDHDHHHGILGHGAHAPHKVLIASIILIFSFAIVEAVGGWWANSLTLMGDAGHMGSDAIALMIAAFAAWMAQKPPSKKHSYGLGRAEVIAAWISSLLMIAISITIVAEAIERIHTPEHVAGGTVMIIASFGLLVNGFVAYLLTRGEQTINIRAALIHVLGDLLGSIAALISGAVIYKTGYYEIDPILSIFIGILILISSLRLFRESLLILMEGVPGHISLQNVSTTLSKIKGVEAIHDLHIWTLSSGVIALSAHVHIQDLNSWQEILSNLRKEIFHQYQIGHITLQPEPEEIECKPCNEPM